MSKMSETGRVDFSEVGYGEGGGFVGWIEVTAMEFAGQDVLLVATLLLVTRDSWPFTTTQLPMGGYEEGRFCRT